MICKFPRERLASYMVVENGNDIETPRKSFAFPTFLTEHVKLPRRPWSARHRGAKGGQRDQLEDGSDRRRNSRGTWPPWVRWVVFSLVRFLWHTNLLSACLLGVLLGADGLIGNLRKHSHPVGAFMATGTSLRRHHVLRK